MSENPEQHLSEPWLCRYWLVKGTQRDNAHGEQWQERCKHGFSKIVDSTFVVEGSNSPKKTFHWFDLKGNLIMTTGYEHDN